MLDAEWQLVYPGTDISFGTPATLTFNRTTPDLGDTELRVADTPRPRSDGNSFGTDYRGGRTISFDLGVRGSTEADVRAEVARLTTAWRADAIRRSPGAVAELRTKYDGRERVVYGRPRRFAPNLSDVHVNLYASIVADFACVDDLFYATADDSERVGTVAATGGGLTGTLSSPLSTTATSDRSVVIDVGGELPAWPIIEIHGPITNAVVEIVDLFAIELRTSVAYDEVITIDTRPWRRTALRTFGGSVAGDVRGTRLSETAIPPGRYEVALRGLDATGTAFARIRWRGTYPSL